MMAKGKSEAITPKAPTKTVYKFISDNKSLTCVALGIQFVNGKAETDNLEIAKALCAISGVTRVED